MMRKWLSYGFVMAALLLALFSCTREEKVVEPAEDGLVTIRFSTAELEVTKATTPGDAQAGDGGGFSDYYMSFNAPAAGMLTIWASSTDATTKKLCILEGGVVTNENCTGTSKPLAGAEVGVAAAGPVTLYPYDGVSRIYKLMFSYENEMGDDVDLIWDFGDTDFQDLLDLGNPLTAQALTILPPATSIPNLDTDTPWTISLNGLTIWSKTASRWVSGAGGYFQWGGYFDPDVELAPVDLVILIADDSDGSIVATYPDSGRDGIVDGDMVSQSTVDAVVSFHLVAKGEEWHYTVYAFGNTAGLWDMTTDGENTITDLTALTNASQVEALKFKPQTRNNTEWEPADDSDDTNEDGVSDTYAALKNKLKYDDGVKLKAGARLPVSGKASLTVSAGGNGEAYLELLRCVAKVTAKIINNTGYPLTLNKYKHTVHGINPEQGWVIPHDNDYLGTPSNLIANPCAKYADPEGTVPEDSVPIPISEEGSKEYDWYVFPSEGPYQLCLQFTLNGKIYSYTHLPITNWRAQDIPALARNQHLTVTTRVSKGLTVSFNFKVVTWAPEDTHTASVEFD